MKWIWIGLGLNAMETPLDNTILIDSSIVNWIQEDWESQKERTFDKRSIRQLEYEYDNVALFWHYLTVAQPQDWKESGVNAGEWVKVSQKALKPLGKSNKDFAILKAEMERLGFANLDNDKKGIHYMAPVFSASMEPYQLRKKNKDLLLGGYEDDDTACQLLRANMGSSISIEAEEARGFIVDKYKKELLGFEEEEANAEIQEVIPDDRKALKQYNKVKNDPRYSKEKYIYWYLNREKITFNRNLNLISAIEHNAGAITRDDSGGRLHSPFTTLRRELREYLRIDGEEVAEIDVSHLHPTLIANEVIKAGRKDNGLLEDCLQNKFYIKISGVLERLSPLMPGLELPPYYDSLRVSKRDRAKDAVMTWLNGSPVSNRTKNVDRKAVGEAMAEYYPDVCKYVDRKKLELRNEAERREPKAKWYPNAGALFARYLQGLESSLFVDQLFLAVSGRYKIPAFTIHDAIYVAKTRKKRVRGLLGRVLADAGIRAADNEGEL